MDKDLRRFLSKTEKTNTCWLWKAGKTSRGYGCFYAQGKQGTAHRWAYEHHKGPVPEGLQIDHLCRVRHCVNPDHLEAVTQTENIRRGEGGRNMLDRTHCPKGHPYNEENTISVKKQRGKAQRKCRVCRNEQQRRRYRRLMKLAEALK